MSGQSQIRFRSDMVVTCPGRFRFDGFVEAGWKRPPRLDEMFIQLSVGQRFPRVAHACWWAPVDTAPAESIEAQRMNWDGGSAASRNGERI